MLRLKVEWKSNVNCSVRSRTVGLVEISINVNKIENIFFKLDTKFDNRKKVLNELRGISLRRRSPIDGREQRRLI